MPASPADSKIFAFLFSDSNVAAVFDDEHYVRAMLEVEVALAKVQGRLGVIPAAAAGQIAAGASALQIDFGRLARETERAGVPVAGLLQQLREQVGGEAASYVHWGATTQDVMDTALVLQIRSAFGVLEPQLLRLIHNLAQLADRHRRTLMAGRTHSQQALPITFGLKVAGWLAPLLRHQHRLAELKPRLLVVQFGGAAGTLAALGQAGVRVLEALAEELELGVPGMPWHTQRDTLAELAGWLSLVSGSLAKMAQDIILMAQSEVSELRETLDPARGGSSTMPQKGNPIISEAIIAAARTNASLLANMHQALVQEHERATHGWQMEWLSLPGMFALTAGALDKAVYLSENLVVDEARMRANVQAGRGLMMAEAISFALAEFMSRDEAKRLVREAVGVTLAQESHLVDVLQEITEAAVDWEALKDESAYLGSANLFIDRVCSEANQVVGDLG